MRFVIIVIATLLSLTGCANPTGQPTQDVLITHDYYSSGLAVRTGGTLALREDGCLAVKKIDGTVSSLILPRNDSSWKDGVLSFHGKEYRTGDDLYSSIAGQGDLTKIGLHVPTGCTVTANPIIVLANNS